MPNRNILIALALAGAAMVGYYVYQYTAVQKIIQDNPDLALQLVNWSGSTDLDYGPNWDGWQTGDPVPQ